MPTLSRHDVRLRAFLDFYDPIRSEVREQLYDTADGPVGLERLKAADSGAQVDPTARDQQIARLQHRAIREGDWKPLDAYLAERGQRYADIGVSFGEWYCFVSAFRDLVAERTDDAEVLLGLGAYIDRVMATIGEAYVARQRARADASEAQVRTLLASVQASPDEVISTTLDGVVTSWNRGAENMYGWSAAEAIGRNVKALMVPEDRHAELDGLLEQLRSGRDVAFFDTERETRDGERLVVSLSVALLRDDDGNPTGASAIARDVTDRRRMERELAQRARELERSNTELEEFAYLASHDLQEPLRMVGSFTELLLKRYGDQLDARGRMYAEFAVDGAKRMQGLINDLLTLARVDSQGRENRILNAQDVVQSVLGEFTEDLHEVRVDVGDLPLVTADPRQFRRVWHDLVDNALKFRAPDRPLRLEVRGETLDDGQIQFALRDNGIGIESRHETRVFEMFQRLHGRERYAGSGIGLAVARRIVDRHDGRIWFDSTPGEGTTFFFTFPGAT